jgi:bifunctional polynucleotide phosphatase/kinase
MWVATEDNWCGGYVPPWEPPPCILAASCPILALDLDHTLICPKEGRKRPQNHADWMWNLGVKHLRDWAARGYRIVLFTNQSACNTPEKIVEFLRCKISPILTALKAEGVTAAALVAGGYSKYRKPKPAMWHFYVERSQPAAGRVSAGAAAPARFVPDLGRSLYVGDAAGRAKDFGDGCDIKFADNIGITFATPQQFVTIPPGVVPHRRDISPQAFGNSPTKWLREKPLEGELPPGVIPSKHEFAFLDTPEIVLMCGSPASGKSSFCWKHTSGGPEPGKPPRAIVSLDTVGTRAKCMRLIRETIGNGGTVLIDETNRNKEMRSHYVKVARKLNVPIRCVYLPALKDLSFHLDALRLDHPDPERSKHKRLPAVSIHTFHKNHQPPDITEGFAEIYVQPFVYDPKLTPEGHFFSWHA